LEVLLSALFTRISLLAPRPAAKKAKGGQGLALHEGDFRTNAEAPLTLEELLALLDGGGDEERRTREHAIACYLSGGDGWREALKTLGGTFAEEVGGLKERKAG
jgi:hypothetical protein